DRGGRGRDISGSSKVFVQLAQDLPAGAAQQKRTNLLGGRPALAPLDVPGLDRQGDGVLQDLVDVQPKVRRYLSRFVRLDRRAPANQAPQVAQDGHGEIRVRPRARGAQLHGAAVLVAE